MSSHEGPSVIQQLLQRVELVNSQQGFMAWDPEKVALDPGGDPGPAYPRLRPPTQESPRLFISYSRPVHLRVDAEMQVEQIDPQEHATMATVAPRVRTFDGLTHTLGRLALDTPGELRLAPRRAEPE
jgi:hypothetical protein